MKFKNNFIIIFVLFIVLICCISAVSAASNNATNVISSEIDHGDDFISMSNEESINVVEDTKLSVQEKDNESPVLSYCNDEEILTHVSVSSSDDKLSAAKNTKSNLQVVNCSNFVKKGEKYYFYLMDLNGNAVPNKVLNINFDGKTFTETTNAYGKVGIKVNLENSTTSSMKVSFDGDNQYNAFSKTLKFYIDNSVSLTIGNTKLLTNGYLRIYLNGPKTSISNKIVQITIGNKVYKRNTGTEGFIVIKPKLSQGKYRVVAKYGDYTIFKVVNCIVGNPKSPLTSTVPTKNGVPDVDYMPGSYIMAYKDGKYSLTKSQYQSVINRDSKFLYLYGKLSKYTFFKSKDYPNINHIIVREKWNVIERALNTKIVKKNQYNYWPSSITVSLKGKSYTYSEVRDIQNTEYTCGPTSASSCSQALRNFHSEKYFQKKANVVSGVNIPVLKRALDNTNFKTSYFYSVDSAVKQLAKGGVALIAFLPNHYVSVIDISPDGKKILVSNSYGAYNVGGASKVPTDWVSIKYFKSKFAGIGLVVKLNYSISKKQKDQLNNIYASMGANWQRQNVNERIPDIGL